MTRRANKKNDELRAVGITCGIGSMLVGARAAGFKIVGNVEWRKYYHAQDPEGRNTFKMNFPGAAFKYNLETMTEDEFKKFSNPDLALGHPECGNFSVLSGPNLKAGHDHRADPADIPLFVDIVAKLKPRYFAMDDLPVSLKEAFPMSEYAARLPDYDLFPEWVSNWGYGNVQRGRNRFFMLGARREEKWAFVPGEQDHSLTVRDVIGDLERPSVRGNIPNNEPHADHFKSTLFISDGKGGRRHATWAETAEIVRAMPEGKTIPYLASDCKTTKLKVGFFRPRWDGHSYVLTGGPNSSLHPTRCSPYSVRERARIQGFPDDFIFYGTRVEGDGSWHILRNIDMVKQTGKAMPIQFNQYVATQVAANIRGEHFVTTRKRILRPRGEVSDAKQWYCANVGYSNQERACGECWLRDHCEIRRAKSYGKGLAASVGGPNLRRYSEDDGLDTSGRVRTGTDGNELRGRGRDRPRQAPRRKLGPPAWDAEGASEQAEYGLGRPRDRPARVRGERPRATTRRFVAQDRWEDLKF